MWWDEQKELLVQEPFRVSVKSERQIYPNEKMTHSTRTTKSENSVNNCRQHFKRFYIHSQLNAIQQRI